MDSVSFDTLKCARRLEGVIERRQKILDQQVADDSNYYAPHAEGDLKESVILSSKMGSGVLVWGVSYAHEQYYKHEFKAKDKNINARWKWFDFAKSVRLKEWLTIANGGD